MEKTVYTVFQSDNVPAFRGWVPEVDERLFTHFRVAEVSVTVRNPSTGELATFKYVNPAERKE